MFCLFCFTEFFDSGQSPVELGLWRKKRQQICKAFYKTVHRVLGVAPKSILGKDALESCCTSCLELINNYSQLAFQTQCMQLRLNWQTKQLLEVITTANSNAAKLIRFRTHFINPSDVPTISRFRNDIIKKCQDDLEKGEPFVSVERLDPTTIQATGNDGTNGIENIQIDSFDTTYDTADAEYIDENFLNDNFILSVPLISSVTSLSSAIDSKSNQKELLLDNRNPSGTGDEDEGNFRNSEECNDNHDNFYEDSVQEISKITLIIPKSEACGDVVDFDETDPFINNTELSVSEESDGLDERLSDFQQTEAFDSTVSNICDQINFILPSNDTEHDLTSGPFICFIPGCEKSFEDESSYEWHCNNHTVNDVRPRSSGKWMCNQCNTQYSTKFNLRRHLKRRHQSDTEVPNGTITKLKSKQSQSHRKPANAVGLGSLHRMFKIPNQASQQVIQSKNSEHKCGVCQKFCRNRFKLNEHMRTHTGDKPYRCAFAFCTSKFATKSNLKRHARLVHKLDTVSDKSMQN